VKGGVAKVVSEGWGGEGCGAAEWRAGVNGAEVNGEERRNEG
jgi:hypothetical protein